jgi:hypothetical protein
MYYLATHHAQSTGTYQLGEVRDGGLVLAAQPALHALILPPLQLREVADRLVVPRRGRVLQGWVQLDAARLVIVQVHGRAGKRKGWLRGARNAARPVPTTPTRCGSGMCSVIL